MDIQIESLFHKLMEYLLDDDRIEDNPIEVLNENVQALVRKFLFQEFQKISPSFSAQEYNKFVDVFNEYIDSKKSSGRKSGTEKKDIREFLKFFFMKEMSVPKFFQNGLPMEKTHQIETFWNVAITTYFILSNEIESKKINILDLTRFIPESFGYDLDYETPSGLILRYISDFQKAYPKFSSKTKINGTAITEDDLTNHLCISNYPGIQWLSSSMQAPVATQGLYNAVIINTQNRKSFTDHFKESGLEYEIDFIKYEDELKKAIASTDQNHIIITVFPIAIMYKEAPSIAISAITDDVAILRPTTEDWEQLYTLYSNYGLKINNIICVDTVFSEPECLWENCPGMCIVSLSAEGATNFEKVLVSEFENGISVEEIQNIVERKGKVTIGTWSETTTVYYLDQEIHFYGLINDAYIRQCNKDKKNKLVKNGFKTYMGRDILQQVEKYISQYDKDFQENSSSIFIPVPPKIFTEVACVGYNFEDYCSSIMEHTFPIKMFDLTQVPWYQYLIKKYELDSEMFKELEDEISNTNVSSKFKFDFNKFGLEIDYNKILCDKQVIQTFSLPSWYNPDVLVPRQIIKANTYQLVLNPDLISVQYLKLLSGTELSYELMKEWFVNCQYMGTVEAFKPLEFTLPSIENQRKIIQYNNHLNLGKIEIEKKKDALRYYLGGSFDNYENTYLSNESFNFNIQPYKETEMQQLPQPIASLLYLDQCEENISRKNTNIIHLFEAVANFHAIVCMSIWKEKTLKDPSCNDIFDSFVHKYLLNYSSDNGTTIQFTIGTWTSLLRFLIRKAEKLKLSYFNISANKELFIALDDSRLLRNENSGHAPRMSEIIEKELYTKLSNQCGVIINALLKIYGKYMLITGPYRIVERSEDGSRVISCYKAMGNTPRLINQKIRVYGNTDFLDHIIYLVPQTFHSVPIPILPFFSYIPLCDKDHKLQSLGYIHEIKMFHDSKTDERKITWYSYDCGDNNIITKNYDEDKTTKDLIDWLEPYWQKKFLTQT